jgi:hypothetical protein
MMAKDIRKDDDIPQEPAKKAGKEAAEENPATHLEPYPTGSPPDPVEAHKEIHPHVYRELEEEPPPPEEDDPKSRAAKRGDETQSKKGK